MQQEVAPDYVKAALSQPGDLAGLRQQLRKREQDVGEELGSVLKREYPSLLQLTSELGEHEQQLEHLSQQVGGSEARLGDVSGAVQATFERLDSKLKERAELQRRAEELRLLQRLAEALSSAEQLLDAEADEQEVRSHAADAAADAGALALSAEVSRLLRVAREVGKLRFLQQHGVRSSASRWQCVQARLLERLRAATLAALQANDEALVLESLRGFAEAGCSDEAGRLVREWVAPQLKPRLQRAVDEQAADDDTYLALLDALCAEVRAVARGPFAPLLQPGVSQLHPRLHLLCDALWAEFCAFVTKSTPHVFGAGIPDVFQVAYLAFTKLKADLEALLHDAAARRYMRAHPASVDLLRRFNMQIYFQLRVQEITRALETALPSELAPVDAAEVVAPDFLLPGAPRALRTAGAAAGAGAFSRCFAPNVFVVPLASKLLRLALQCVARFDSWLQARVMGAHATPPSPAAAATQSTPADALYALVADVQALSSWFDGDALAAAVLDTMGVPEQSTELQADCRAALRESGDALDASNAKLRQAVVKLVAEQCCVALAPSLSLVVRADRMTNMPMPSNASFFVADVMKPLRTFLARHAPLPASHAELVGEVCGTVTRHFDALARKLLDDVRQGDEALRLMQTRQAAPQAEAARGTNADIENIHAQLFLDATAYGQQLEELGVSLEAHPAFAALLCTVQPGAEEGAAEQQGAAEADSGS